MIKINNKFYVLEDMQTILFMLREEVAVKLNKSYFRNVKRAGNSVLTNCPIHKSGQERKPSAGFRQSDGLMHCFTCGEVWSLTEVISHIFEKADGGRFGEKWLRDNCTVAIIDNRDLGDFPLKYKQPKQKIENYISEEELEKYRVNHEYMYKRGLTDELIEMFDVGFDPDFKLKKEDGTWSNKIPCITFPVRDKEGNTLFIARRSIEGKLFHYPADVMKPLYGIYELYRYEKIGKQEDGSFCELDKLIITESILNATNCWKYGIPAIALLGTGSKEQYPLLRRLPVDKLYLGLDPDGAGDKGTLRLLKNLKRTGIKILDIPEGKDLNDLSEDEFYNLRKLSPNEWKRKYDYF